MEAPLRDAVRRLATDDADGTLLRLAVGDFDAPFGDSSSETWAQMQESPRGGRPTVTRRPLESRRGLGPRRAPGRGGRSAVDFRSLGDNRGGVWQWGEHDGEGGVEQHGEEKLQRFDPVGQELRSPAAPSQS